MTKPDVKKPSYVIVSPDDLYILFEELSSNGYKIIGPAIRDGAISYEYLKSPQDLPVGYIDRQEAGHYSLNATDKKLFFNYRAAANTWKRYLYPPRQKLWEAMKKNKGFKIDNNRGKASRLAFLGVLPCDLSAINILDKILIEGPYTDSLYRNIRKKNLIIASNCTSSGSNCFCVSMNTGPRALSSFDLAFTEIIIDKKHMYVFESGSEPGSKLLNEIPHRKAAKVEIDCAESAIKNTASGMVKKLDMKNIQNLLDRCFDHPNWQKIASRCLTCGNCTMICPTCFCSTVEDITDLPGDTARRWRSWDSCFTREYSYIAGGSVRHTARARYRQWFTHKLANWHSQFGTSGCVGCGRCVTWCPVGIDITEEARLFRESGIMLHGSISKEDK